MPRASRRRGDAARRHADTIRFMLFEARPVGLSGGGSAHADDWDRSPDGAVCICPKGKDPAQDPRVNPTHVFRSYGVHRIINQFNTHWAYDNLHSGATVQICRGADGTGCGGGHYAQTKSGS